MQPAENCSKCKGPLTHMIVDSVQGSHGDVHVTLRNIPMDQCASCGERQFPHGDLSLRFLTSLTGDKGIKYARRKGWFSKTLLCCNCKGELSGTPQSGKYLIAMQVNEASNVQLEFEAPSYKCWCGTQQLATSSKEFIALAEALGEAIKSATSAGMARPATS